MSVYISEPMDSLPSIAEAFGYPGEWAAIWELNKETIPDPNTIYPGMEINVPGEWTEEPQNGAENPPEEVIDALEDVTSSARKRGSSSSRD